LIRVLNIKLAQPHESHPWNPIIANVFYRAGIIERWGSGTLNIIDWCMENGNPKPTWREQAGSVYITFLPAVLQTAPEVTDHVTDQVTDQVGKLLNLLLEETLDAAEMMARLGLSHRPTYRENYLHPALGAVLIEMTIPDKPRSSKQRDQITNKGQTFLSRSEGGGVHITRINEHKHSV